jgi:hypothetical protein
MDRCDRCGAQAYMRVMLESGGELIFCLHHGREYEPRLRQMAAHIEDHSQTLAGAAS